MRCIKVKCKIVSLLLCVLLLAACGAGGASASDAAGDKHQKQVFAMDTVMILNVYGENAEAALGAAEERILELEADLDPENEDGSVYALNSNAGTDVPVSRDCCELLIRTMDVWSSTGGALDPGVYPLSRAWGFIDADYRVPPQEEIEALLAAKDTAGIRADGDACTAMVPEGTEIAFGASAKGYTAQAICGILREMGVESAVVSLGGNVQTLGETKPDGSAWKVAVVDPLDSEAYAAVLEIGEAAVVTSGGYQRYFTQDGTTYIHILDPETGYPADSGLLSVTVVTDDGTLADSLSTALFVMGEEGALSYYEEIGGFELVLITADERVVVTPGLRDSFRERSETYTYEYLG